MLIGIDGNEANIKDRVGSNVYAHELLWQLHKQVSSGKFQAASFKIYLKNKPLPDLPKENKNWRYEVFGPGRLWTQWRLPLKLYLDKEKPDVFFTPGHYAPRFCPVPSVVSVMDLAFLKFPKDFLEKDLKQLKAWTKYSVRNANHIFAISEATKNDIVEYYGVDDTKITVTYPGVERAKSKEPMAKTQIKNVKLKYNINSPYLIYVGTLQPRKNIVRLIKAFKSLQLPASSFQLTIVGKKGWLYNEIFKQVNKSDLCEKVVFTGFAPNNELQALMKGAKALVLPSLYEGFGIPVVEAMSAGVPVVVSRVSSLPEIAGNAGIYIDNPKSMDSIYCALQKIVRLSEEKRKELVLKGKKQAEKFSWEKCGEKTLKILKNFENLK